MEGVNYSTFSMLESAFYGKEDRFVNEVLDLSYIPGDVLTESEKKEYIKDPAKYAKYINDVIEEYKRNKSHKNIMAIVGLLGIGLGIITVGGIVPAALVGATATAVGFLSGISIGGFLAIGVGRMVLKTHLNMINKALENDSLSASDKKKLETLKKKLEEVLAKKKDK